MCSCYAGDDLIHLTQPLFSSNRHHSIIMDNHKLTTSSMEETKTTDSPVQRVNEAQQQGRISTKRARQGEEEAETERLRQKEQELLHVISKVKRCLELQAYPRQLAELKSQNQLYAIKLTNLIAEKDKKVGDRL
jgi:hypothetical protein